MFSPTQVRGKHFYLDTMASPHSRTFLFAALLAVLGAVVLGDQDDDEFNSYKQAFGESFAVAANARTGTSFL